MKILVTGASGFVGSQVTRLLISKGLEVSIVTRETSDLWRISHLLSVLHRVHKSDIKKDFSQNRYDCVVHCATNYGHGGTRFSEIVRDNVVWPLELFELGERNGLKLFINTDTFYGKNSLLYSHLQFYTQSKQMFLDFLSHYDGKIKIASMRLEHVYGPQDSQDKFVESIRISLVKKIEKIDFTDGEQLRDFIYVQDVARAFLKIIEKEQFLAAYQEFEVGTGNSTSIKSFVTLLSQLMNNRETNLNWGALKRRSNEITRSYARNQELIKFGWEPPLSIEEGLRKTLNFQDV